MKVGKLNEVTFLLKCFREKHLWITFKSVMSLRLAIMEIYRHLQFGGTAAIYIL